MNNYRPEYGTQKSGLKARYILILVFLAFIAGGILMVWAAQRLDLFGSAPKSAAAESATAKKIVTAEPAFDSLPPPIAPVTGGEVTEQVENLEARLSRINAEAQAASGNANRAEGMLLAFAARRAIDSGAALGYVETQLRNRFGANHPQEIKTILNAVRNPVTLDILRAELTAQGDAWLAQDGLSAWGRFQKELSELFVLRPETTPAPAPTRRLERARQFTEVGNIEAAIKEVEKLPGAKEANEWLAKARSYNAVRKSLDNIERAALAQPPALITPPQQTHAGPAKADTAIPEPAAKTATE